MRVYLRGPRLQRVILTFSEVWVQDSGRESSDDVGGSADDSSRYAFIISALRRVDVRQIYEGLPDFSWYNAVQLYQILLHIAGLIFMGKCTNHPERETPYLCQKHQQFLCEECLYCKDPELYCKFRSACPIWFIHKERARQERQENERKTGDG